MKSYSQSKNLKELMKWTICMYIIAPQLLEVSRNLNLKGHPNIYKFDVNKSFNSKNGPFLAKKEIMDFLINRKLLNNNY